MKGRRILVDKARYVTYLNGVVKDKLSFGCHQGDLIALIDREDGTIYRDIIDSENKPKILPFYELAGGIFILGGILPSSFYPITTIYTRHVDGNYIHIEYDGITHLTIEDVDYIYNLDLPHYIPIDVEYREGIFLIRYEETKGKHLIIVKKDRDYIEIANIVGHSIDVTDEEIVSKTRYSDSLGRIKVDTYMVKDGKYVLSNRKFEYTYIGVSDQRLLIPYLEDAIFAGDIDYVMKNMRDEVDRDSLRSYFDSILHGNIEILRIGDIDNTMRFCLDKGYEKVIVGIKVIFDSDGKIVNFE